MYKLLKKKKGKPNNKNLVVYYLSQGTSKFMLNLVAKKFYKTSPRFFVFSPKQQILSNIFYKLSHRSEFKKIHVELYLSVTGILYAKSSNFLYYGYNPLAKLHVELPQSVKKQEIVFF